MLRYEVKSDFSKALKKIYEFANNYGYRVEHYNTKTFQSILLVRDGNVVLTLYRDKILNKTFITVY
jgi:hypothetical protein